MDRPDGEVEGVEVRRADRSLLAGDEGGQMGPLPHRFDVRLRASGARTTRFWTVGSRKKLVEPFDRHGDCRLGHTEPFSCVRLGESTFVQVDDRNSLWMRAHHFFQSQRI